MIIIVVLSNRCEDSSVAKKYSVQMEDDKIVSVEVDGVTYTNPDEIPDEQDREKIQTVD